MIVSGSKVVISHLEVSKRRLIEVNMPVSGLPAAMSGAVNDPLQEQTLSSWNEVGDVNATVVVLTFLPADPATMTTSPLGR